MKSLTKDKNAKFHQVTNKRRKCEISSSHVTNLLAEENESAHLQQTKLIDYIMSCDLFANRA